MILGTGLIPLWLSAGIALQFQTTGQPTAPVKSGPDLYQSACAACHGPDGKGVPQTAVGFRTPVPDFTDCSFATPEPDADWLAVIHGGGPMRAFDRMMPYTLFPTRRSSDLSEERRVGKECTLPSMSDRLLADENRDASSRVASSAHYS